MAPSTGPVWGWDVEASDPARPWDGATLIVARSTAGDREVFEGSSCLERVAKLMDRTGGTWLAHYGGGYDVPLLLNWWRPRRVVLSGTTILCAEGKTIAVRDEETGDVARRPLRLRDTFPWWLAALAKVGKAVGLPKIDVDRAAMERLTPAELVPYCERDVEILLAGHDACRSFLREHGVTSEPWTAGASAMELVRAVEPGTYAACKRLRCDVDDVMDVLQSGAARGGMVACNARGVVEGVYCYDRKSAYPAAYVDDDIGIGLRRATPAELRSPETFIGSALARWRWTDRERVPPALDQWTQCGVGECRSWLTEREIGAFLALGVSVELTEGWCPIEVLPFAQAFARLMFAAKEGGGSASFFAKVFVNACTGKTAMSPLREEITAWPPRRYWGPRGPRSVPEGSGPRSRWWWRYLTLSMDAEHKLSWYQQPMVSIATFGRARHALWSIDDRLHNAGWPVLYNDTDSVFTTCPPDRMPVPLGEGIGELAFEGGPYRGYFLGPKAYCLVDDAGRVAKCALKGIPHRSYADGVIDPASGVFREARGDERQRGTGPWTRKGVGRDVRVALFERALREQTGSVCVKDGLATFLRGLAGTDAEGPGVWKRAPVTRTVRPSGRGKVHLGPTTFAYLSIVETGARRALTALVREPAREETARKRHGDDVADFMLARGLVATSQGRSGPVLSATLAGRTWLDGVGGPLVPLDELRTNDLDASAPGRDDGSYERDPPVSDDDLPDHLLDVLGGRGSDRSDEDETPDDDGDG